MTVFFEGSIILNYKMTIAYDGTRFNGWQRQKENDNTIQTVLEKAISEFLGEKVEIFGSGRTDAGVHAKGQTANFKTDKKFESFIEEINKKIPSSIAVKSIERVDDRFHSRLSAKSKTYEYTIWKADYNNAFSKKFAFECKGLDVEKMKEAAYNFIGTHDFKGFCANKRMKKSTVREIYSIELEENDETIKIKYTGNGFLYNMVRILTGTLIEVGEGKRTSEEAAAAIKTKKREDAGFTAPANGLCLNEVYY